MPNEVATRPKTELIGYLETEDSMREIAIACSKWTKPETVVQIVNILTYRNPELLKCEPASVLHSIIQGASLGLSFQPSAGEAYLVPRWNKKANCYECQFQPGFQGLAKLARESGKVNIVKAELVREGDVFRITRTPEVELFHEPNTKATFDTPITHVYAWSKLSSGEIVLEVMDIAEVEYIRSRAQSPDKGPWVSDYGEMVKKTAIRRLCKSLPKTPQMMAAIEAHDAGFDLATGQLEGTEKPLAVTNNTGHGSGKYASPADVAKYLKAMEAYLDKRNQQWADRWAGKDIDGLKELCNRWQADGHLAKWAEQCGMISPCSVPEGGLKNRQIGQLTAIIYCGSPADRKKLAKELESYIDKQEQIALVKLQRDHPELFEASDVTDDEVLGDSFGEAVDPELQGD